MNVKSFLYRVKVFLWKLLLVLCGGGWLITELIVLAYLISGMTRRHEMIVFSSAHALSMLLTYGIYRLMIGKHPRLRKLIISKDMTCFVFTLTVIPFAGPLIMIYAIFYLQYRHIYIARPEDFNKLDMDSLGVLQTTFSGQTVPIMKAILIRGLSRDDAFEMINLIGEMEWNFIKSRLLKNIIRLSPFKDVILMAIDMITQKMDDLLAQITHLESLEKTEMDEAMLRKLADLYHEICYLELCDPFMKRFYQEKACDYAVQTFNKRIAKKNERLDEKSLLEDHARLATKYLLEADRVDEAKSVYDMMRKGNYFFDQWMPHEFKTYMFFVERWISYEFEIYLKDLDQDRFEALYYLIEFEEGVFIPQKVKEAAYAWKMALTSAWL
jgi:hypothetical protein